MVVPSAVISIHRNFDEFACKQNSSTALNIARNKSRVPCSSTRRENESTRMADRKQAKEPNSQPIKQNVYHSCSSYYSSRVSIMDGSGVSLQPDRQEYQHFWLL